MELRNTTQLDPSRLEAMFLDAVIGWPHDGLRVFVRYSRGADFSGTCFYRERRIHINLGRHNHYPYEISTNIGKTQSSARYWWRELYSVAAADAYQLALFIFLHEFYHYLVKRARRNVRQKESRCDRFATRILADEFGAAVRDRRGRRVPRSSWDFQDLDGFVDAARRTMKKPGRQARRGRQGGVHGKPEGVPGRQLLLFGPSA